MLKRSKLSPEIQSKKLFMEVTKDTYAHYNYFKFELDGMQRRRSSDVFFKPISSTSIKKAIFTICQYRYSFYFHICQQFTKEGVTN